MALEIDIDLEAIKAEMGEDQPKQTIAERPYNFGLPLFEEPAGEMPPQWEGVNFLDAWTQINKSSKSPLNFYRWVGISMMGALLERNVYIPFAKDGLYPNMYVLLVGESASYKSTAIITGRKAMDRIGYPNFSPNRVTSKEMHSALGLKYKARRKNFIITDSSSNILKADVIDNILQTAGTPSDLVSAATTAKNDSMQSKLLLDAELDALTSLPEELRPGAMYALASEFSEFVPEQGATVLYSLTDLYDTQAYEIYEFSESTYVYNPCVNLLGGIPPSALAQKFKVSDLEQGFITRVIMVHSESRREEIDPLTQGFNIEDDNYVTLMLRKIRNLRGIFEMSDKAKQLCAKINKFQPKVTDIRLQQYNGRRYAHLVKLAMVRAAGDLSLKITSDHVMWANTVLSYTETSMPDALGDFGTTPELAISNAVTKILHQSKTGTMKISDLTANVALLRPKEYHDKILKVMSDMIKKGSLLREQANSETESIVWLKDKKSNKLQALDGDIINSSLIEEWIL